MNNINIPLFDSYIIKSIDFNLYHSLLNDYYKTIFKNAPQLKIPRKFSNVPLVESKFKELQKQMFYLCLGIFENEKPIGWFYGIQEKGNVFYMTNTGILPEYQNKGIYSAFLEELINILNKEQFQQIKSQHSLNNNQVLIPKLKKGFSITGIEVLSAFGTLVTLTLHLNENEKKAFSYKIGRIKHDEEIESWQIY